MDYLKINNDFYKVTSPLWSLGEVMMTEITPLRLAALTQISLQNKTCLNKMQGHGLGILYFSFNNTVSVQCEL